MPSSCALQVSVSTRLESTPCIVTTSQYGYSANMERIMKAQAFSDPTRAQHMLSKKTLEVNPRHPIISELLKRVTENAEVRALVLCAEYDIASLCMVSRECACARRPGLPQAFRSG